jgi:hypothetical protein
MILLVGLAESVRHEDMPAWVCRQTDGLYDHRIAPAILQGEEMVFAHDVVDGGNLARQVWEVPG